MSKNQFYYLKDKSGLSALTKSEGEIPKPGKGEVLVRVHACSLNYRDLLMASGKYPGGIDNLVPLSDGAGEIVEVGEGVTLFKKGDRVYSTFFQFWQGGQVHENLRNIALGGGVHGMLTQYKVLSEHGVIKIPSHLSYEEASTLPCAAVTAYNSLFEAQYPLLSGETALILGTGGVSIFGLQFAKAAGARVITTSSSDEKLEIAKKLGSDDLINYKSHPDWDKKVLELTNGRGVDHVVEVGGAGTFPRSLRSTKPGGHVGVIGLVAAGDENGAALTILGRNLNVRGVFVGSNEMYHKMNRMIEYHKIKPIVDKVFSFDEATAAYEYLQSQKHVGKVVIKL
eukprot:TRINITY_DN27961_c0_g1_i1.p1 TRINITY_DN27961_c0_g1~~TRINITY_DN27961_c0_g1_i1.p1  ORF type:complete len:340 (+),score=106.55 TRINITY_DN27961_c0_g1_i1:53-1072(+)